MPTTIKFRSAVLLPGLIWLTACAWIPTTTTSTPAAKPAPTIADTQPAKTRTPRWKEWLPKPDVSPRQNIPGTTRAPISRTKPKIARQTKPLPKSSQPSKEKVVAVAQPKPKKTSLSLKTGLRLTYNQ